MSERVHVGTGHLICGVCSEQLPIPVYMFVTEMEGDDEHCGIVCEPDVSEVWSHAWSVHGGE